MDNEKIKKTEEDFARAIEFLIDEKKAKRKTLRIITVDDFDREHRWENTFLSPIVNEFVLHRLDELIDFIKNHRSGVLNKMRAEYRKEIQEFLLSDML